MQYQENRNSFCDSQNPCYPELPLGWCITTISQVSVKGAQRKPDNQEKFLYIDIGSIDRERKTIDQPQILFGSEAPSRARKCISYGDILVSLTRPNLNAVALVTAKYDGQIASTGFEVIKPLLIDPRYLFALTRSKQFIDAISGKVQGALYPAAKSSDVQSFVFPLPPLAEQIQIANKLDELLAQVDTLKTRLDAIPHILKRFRQSVLAAAVSGRLTEDWREENSLGSAYETAYIDEIKKPQKYSLGIGPFGSNLKVSDYQKEGYPLVFVREIRAKDFGGPQTKFVSSAKFQELKAHRVLPGNVLITKMGDPPGDVAIYPTSRPEAVITSDCIKLSVNEAVAENRYVAYAMQSPQFRNSVLTISAGVAQQKMNLKKFRKLELPLPSLLEQTEIVRRVEQLFAYADQIEQRVKDTQSRVNKLTQSILAKAFRGELTAEWRAQNPDLITGENSAEALLARIKAERAANESGKKPKRAKKG